MPVATVGPGRQSGRFRQLPGAFACQIKVPELVDGGEAKAFSASVNVLVLAHPRASPAPPAREEENAKKMMLALVEEPRMHPAKSVLMITG